MDKIIDTATGEIKREMKPGDRVISGNTVKYLNATQEWKIEHFYKGNLGEIKKWLKDLTPNEKAVLFTLSPYISYEDCCLKDEGEMLTFDDMVELSGLSRGTVSTTLNTLIEKDILYKGKNSKERQYFVNPWLFCKGNRINKVLKTMFRNYQIRVLNNVKWKNIKS